MSYLSRDQLARVAHLWPDLSWAIRRVILPARYAFGLAGMSYRESEFRDDAPGEAGGAFCLDQGSLDANRAFVDEALRDYPHAAKDRTLESDFVTAALVAAAEMKKAARQSAEASDRGIGLALARYNGFPHQYCEKWQTGSGSEDPSPAWHPYVSNDPERGFLLKIVGGTVITGDGGRTETPVVVDRRPGALVIARELEARWAEWYVAGLERPARPEFE